MMSRVNRDSATYVTAKSENAILCSIVAILAVLFFELHVHLLSSLTVVIIPYLTLVIVSAVLGYVGGDWYLTQSRTQLLVIIVMPILIIIVSLFSAGLIFGVSSYFFWNKSLFYSNFFGQWGVLWGGFKSSLVFIYVTWPVLLVGSIFCSATVYLRYRQK